MTGFRPSAHCPSDRPAATLSDRQKPLARRSQHHPGWSGLTIVQDRHPNCPAASVGKSCRARLHHGMSRRRRAHARTVRCQSSILRHRGSDRRYSIVARHLLKLHANQRKLISFGFVMSKSCSNNVSFTTSPTTMSSVAARWCWCASRRKPIGLIGSNISHGTSSKSSAEYGFSVLTHARILLFYRSAIKRRLRGRTIE